MHLKTIPIIYYIISRGQWHTHYYSMFQREFPNIKHNTSLVRIQTEPFVGPETIFQSFVFPALYC